MRRLRALAAVVVPLAALATVGLANPAAAAAPQHYVALGDSYSSGVGTGTSSGPCGTSPQAFPAVYAATTKPATFTQAACSGATTADVQSTQVAALSSATTLASITIGGNDVGFSSILETCVLHGTSTCVAAVNSAETYAQNTLPGLLGSTYGSIRSHAPHAHVVVLSYPLFYDLGPWLCLGLSRTDHTKLDEGIRVLDGVVKTAATRAGFSFADVRPAFTGHEICDGGSSWLHALNVAHIDESYHPTANGQSKGYEPVFAAAAR
jgi:lysophospholipase L1-like esterase